MIPYRKPPFGLRTITRAIINWSDSISAEQVENAYTQAYGMPYAILLPSCRAGIYWALKAVVSRETKVLCTAYVCRVVWEAIKRTEGQLDLIDLKKNSFLMDENKLLDKQVGNYALVLCEVYGCAYNILKIAQQTTTAPAVRIIDMAMTVPTKQHFERLNESDLAVMSFGAGKCMYAGWGGMALTRNADLAKNMRQIRDNSLTPSSRASLFMRSLKIFAVNLAYKRPTYGLLQRTRETEKSAGKNGDAHIPKTFSEEWFSPSAYVEKNLMLYNLQHAAEYAEQRINLAKRYHKNFEGIPEIMHPDTLSFPMSHYTIRVRPETRPVLRNYLHNKGIDTGMLFDFSKSLSPEEFPNASETASSVLNLPLCSDMSPTDIDKVSESVIQGYRGIMCEHD